MSDIINNTIIWILCRKGIISLPYKKPKGLKLEDWWDEKDDPKPKLRKLVFNN
jgi:hypothetical protein